LRPLLNAGYLTINGSADLENMGCFVLKKKYKNKMCVFKTNDKNTRHTQRAPPEAMPGIRFQIFRKTKTLI